MYQWSMGVMCAPTIKPYGTMASMPAGSRGADVSGSRPGQECVDGSPKMRCMGGYHAGRDTNPPYVPSGTSERRA